MPKISILIPSRSGDYLNKTIEDILEHSTETEVIAGIDGLDEFREVIPRERDRVKVHIERESIGQRAMTNILADMSDAKYVLKTDSHCSFAPGFDAVMLSEIDDRTILAPYLMPLEPIAWAINGKKKTSRYCFDTKLVMQYDQENDERMPETMCLQGSAWMVLRNHYWQWNLGDESLGSWGGQGVELGIKAFLNGGRCVTTKNTFYGHMFKHTEAEFFYDRGPNPGKQATDELLRRFKNKAIAPLIEKFGYPADWSPQEVANLPA